MNARQSLLRIKLDFISCRQHAPQSGLIKVMTSIPTAQSAGQPTLIYEHVRPFDVSDGDMRIFAPISYPLVRNVQLVPVVHSEALTLAHRVVCCHQINSS